MVKNLVLFVWMIIRLPGRSWATFLGDSAHHAVIVGCPQGVVPLKKNTSGPTVHFYIKEQKEQKEQKKTMTNPVKTP